MPIGNLSTATITATYVDYTGAVTTGKVVFTPQGNLKAAAGDKILLPKKIEAVLNGSGAISVVLPVGDADYGATITYLVEELIDGQAGKFGQDPYYIALVAGDATTTIPLLARAHVTYP